MDKIEDSAVQNPHKSVPDLPLQASSSNFAADPPLGGSDHVAEDRNQHPDQWLTQLQNLDLEEQATGIESRNGASDGEDGGRKASGKREWESDGDNRIEKLVNDDVIDGKNATEGFAFPLRPEAVDCAFYMKTGNCKYGASCKFNHPVRTKNQDANEESEEMGQKPRHIECKHYLRTGGCKYGKDCRYFHSKAKPHVFPISELNFLGLPIRPGEKECPFYMRNGSCKFGAYCKFNHPNPKAVGEADPDPVYVNGALGGPITSSQANVASWSVPRPFNETASYVPVISSTQGFPSQSSEWNGYQTPEYPQERSMHPLAAFVTDNIATETSIYGENQTLISDDEFPERPGEPVCNYFLKTGDCKFKSNCKYHHPKNQAPKPPPCALSDKGLPLRPDQNICSYYSRYGICKFGPACKFDHPINLSSSSLSDSGKPVASTNYPLGSKSRVGSYMG